jgi:tetratricopeptide (TPR) repeat protein
MRKIIFVVLASLIAFPASSSAQRGLADEPLKPGTARDRPLCPVATVGVAPAPALRQQARQLKQQGQQAAILGDSPAALRALRDASVLDPTDADLAYQLGQAYETAKDAPNAVAQYCRFLSLAPTSPDAGEVFERVRALAPARSDQVIDVALAVFRSGVAAYQNGQLAAADSAFTRAILADSGWADAYYNRGRVRFARGDRDAGRADLIRYLTRVPEATDRREVARVVSDLGPEVLSPLLAFGLSAVIPGGGEFYVHRPIRGSLTVVAVAAASVWAAQTQTINTTEASIRVHRPHLYAGIAAALGAAALSAVDATFHAWSTQDPPVRLGLSIEPGANAIVARVSIR